MTVRTRGHSSVDLVKSPKSDAFPVVGIAIKSMVLITLGDPPPPKQARVGEETPAHLLKLAVLNHQNLVHFLLMRW